MKAYLIDPVEKTVTQVEVDAGIKAIYAAIKCDCFDLVRINDRDSIYVNDNGLFDGTIDKYGMFVVTGTLRALPLAGYGLVLGSTPDGESADVKATLQEVAAMVTFPSLAEIRARAATGEFD